MPTTTVPSAVSRSQLQSFLQQVERSQQTPVNTPARLGGETIPLPRNVVPRNVPRASSGKLGNALGALVGAINARGNFNNGYRTSYNQAQQVYSQVASPGISHRLSQIAGAIGGAEALAVGFLPTAQLGQYLGDQLSNLFFGSPVIQPSLPYNTSPSEQAGYGSVGTLYSVTFFASSGIYSSSGGVTEYPAERTVQMWGPVLPSRYRFEGSATYGPFVRYIDRTLFDEFGNFEISSRRYTARYGYSPSHHTFSFISIEPIGGNNEPIAANTPRNLLAPTVQPQPQIAPSRTPTPTPVERPNRVVPTQPLPDLTNPLLDLGSNALNNLPQLRDNTPPRPRITPTDTPQTQTQGVGQPPRPTKLGQECDPCITARLDSINRNLSFNPNLQIDLGDSIQQSTAEITEKIAQLDCCDELAAKLDRLLQEFDQSGAEQIDRAPCDAEPLIDPWLGQGLGGLYRALETLSRGVNDIWAQVKCPVELPDETRFATDVIRASRPQIVLDFLERPEDVDAGYRAVRGRIGFRLMNLTAETATPEVLRPYAQRIKNTFGENSGYVWRRGKLMFAYTHWELGYSLKLLCRNEVDARNLITAILSIQNHTPNWSKMTTQNNVEPGNAYPVVPETIQIYGKQQRLPRRRPVADVRFRYAKLQIADLQNRPTLVDITGRYQDVLVP